RRDAFFEQIAVFRRPKADVLVRVHPLLPRHDRRLGIPAPLFEGRIRRRVLVIPDHHAVIVHEGLFRPPRAAPVLRPKIDLERVRHPVVKTRRRSYRFVGIFGNIREFRVPVPAAGPFPFPFFRVRSVPSVPPAALNFTLFVHFGVPSLRPLPPAYSAG